MPKRMEIPTYQDVERAAAFIRPHLAITPLLPFPSLGRKLGCEFYLKCENFQPVGAFKVRGGVNLVGHLSAEESRRGVASASTGNHGQSLAFAGRIFDVPVAIYAPQKNANPLKIKAMRELGATVHLFGEDFDEAREEVERVAEQEGWRYIHSANEPMLIAGVGTTGIEIFDALPEVDVIIVPVGAGSGVCGNLIVAKELNPEVQVIGVQSSAAPACREAWKTRTLSVTASMNSRHEGLATRIPFALTLEIMWKMLDAFVLVEDAAIDSAIVELAQSAHLIAEGAGAAPLAAAYQLRDLLQGKRVVAVVSGGNIPLNEFARLL